MVAFCCDGSGAAGRWRKARLGPAGTASASGHEAGGWHELDIKLGGTRRRCGASSPLPGPMPSERDGAKGDLRVALRPACRRSGCENADRPDSSDYEITLKAIVQDKYGSPNVLQLEDIDKPVVNDDEVLIRVHA